MYNLLIPFWAIPKWSETTYIQDFGVLESLETYQTIDILRRLRQLPDNWDGEGAVAFKECAIENSISIVQFIASQHLPDPDVSPNPHGTVAMEWENDYGYAYVEVGSTKLTALIKTSARKLIFSLDRVEADDIENLRSLAFHLQSVLYPDSAPMISSKDITATSEKWAGPLFDANNLSTQSLVAVYDVAVAN